MTGEYSVPLMAGMSVALRVVSMGSWRDVLTVLATAVPRASSSVVWRVECWVARRGSFSAGEKVDVTAAEMALKKAHMRVEKMVGTKVDMRAAWMVLMTTVRK